MCTSLKYRYCMGRNFDYEISYKEIPRTYTEEIYSIKGIVADIADYPLFYDAMNERGLCMAGLNFEGNAYYYPDEDKSKKNVAPWELIPKVLGICKNVQEAKDYLINIRIIDKPFNKDLPNSPLHWFICDSQSSITVEQTKENGLQIYDNKYNVMTNNPPYPLQEEYFYMNKPANVLGKAINKLLPKKMKTRGTATYGVAGGLTSFERYQRAVLFKEKLEQAKSKFNAVIETMHLMDNVSQIYGATPVEDKYEYTIYSVVYNMQSQKMYIKRYNKLEIEEY